MRSPCVLRGGSWFSIPISTRSANRYESDSTLHLYDFGFRLVREPESPRVVRGGSWFNRHGGTRSANRDGIDSTTRGSFSGFRLVREPK